MRQLLAAVALLGFAAAPVLAEGPAPAKQIYFGDLHTHSNISADAVVLQLAHGVERGPEAACLYAAACAQADFYGQSDHAEMTDWADWQRIQAAVTACNELGRARAGDGADPSFVAFQGFEWTSSVKGVYWGHKNVFFKNDAVPELPIAAIAIGEVEARRLKGVLTVNRLLRPLDPPWGQRWRAFKRAAAVNDRGRCAPGADFAAESCILVAPEPKDLFGILNAYGNDPAYRQAGFDAMVIPHGTAWGTAKLGANWDIQLNADQHDPQLQSIVEVYSGHGNSEEWRDFGNPESGYQSCPDRAAELQAERCAAEAVDADACADRIAEARRTATVPFDTTAADWGDCGQCTDCFQPAERYQPDGSVQAALAKTAFDADGQPAERYHFGFIAATDDHAAKPAGVMESRTIADWALAIAFQGAFDSEFIPEGRNRIEAERLGSFFYPGGLVAIHAESRTREALWSALQRREVYGTSGPRIELWFDADVDGTAVAMGQRIASRTSPRFEVSVHGAPVEQPGCSDETRQSWGDDVVENVCANVCFNPSDERVGIDRLEIVRIRPQAVPNEPLTQLIDDPWRVIANPNTTATGAPTAVMRASFEDPEFAAAGRDALYYVRAIQVPTLAVNGTPLRNAAGNYEICPRYNDEGNDCLSPLAERAWSSPIYVDYR